MPTEVIFAAASAFLALLVLGMLLMKTYPKVMMVAPVPTHPCGFVPNL